jgi:hypothetical protein
VGQRGHSKSRGLLFFLCQINGRILPAFPIIKFGKTRLPTKYAHERTAS